MMEAERVLMKRALELARLGAGLVSPNPMVGALLVKDGRVVGEGYHRFDRLKHAESYALESAGKNAAGATLYCTLEPCCTQGRTPPCTDALIAARIARAVIAIRDPNPKVNGRGIEQLRAAGIDVEVGLCEEESRNLIESYSKFITTRLPFVHAVTEHIVGSQTDEGSITRSHKPAADWSPSKELCSDVVAYDALVLGGEYRSEAKLVNAKLQQRRHRPLVQVAVDRIVDKIRHKLAGNSDVIVWKLSDLATMQNHAARAGLRIVTAGGDRPSGTEHFEINELMMALGKLGVTSFLATPGAFDFADEANFRVLDKLTLLASADFDFGSSTRMTLGEVEFDFADVTSTHESNHTELTGYPTLLEIA